MKLASLFAFTLTGVLVSSAAAEDAPGTQVAKTSSAEERLRLNYLLYLPKEYTTEKPWPLVLFLHGAGERGDNLDQVKRHGPPKLIEAGRQFPFICISPQCPRGEWWDSAKLVALLDDVAGHYKVDADRIYVTGLSMGGFGTFSLAAAAPQKLAAIAPICGGGDPGKAKSLVHLPTWVFHGAKDQVVPLKRSEDMVEALKKEGGDPKFTIYPEANHDSWTATYNNDEFYQWLLEQKRPVPAQE